MANRASTFEHDDDALFVKNGVPVKFCFHRSVTQGRGRITRDVERHGGQIVISERLANVLLVDEQEDLAFIRRRYYSSTVLHRLSLYVEPRGFVQTCIRAGHYRHIGPIKQGMPGRAPGAARARVPFTEEDRDHLAYYLATRCPTRDGRMGNNAYKDLERLGQSEDQSWAWARHHTFHSWREHYKINSQIMDVRIEHYVQRLRGVGHHFGHDPRRHDYKNLRQEEEEESEEEVEEEDEEIQEGEPEQQDYERRERASPAHAERRPERAARDYFARHEQDLVVLDDEGDDDMQAAAIQEPERRRDIGHAPAKQARVSGNKRQASGVEASRGEGSSAREEDTSSLESVESDLFGDRMYDFDEGMYMPEPFSPRASPVPKQDGPPLSTQTTLIASPRSHLKPTARESPEDEMAVEGLLGTTLENDMASSGERDEADEDSDEEDDDMMEELPRYQVIEISGPSDSDDAETHATLARDAVQEGFSDEAGSDQDEGDDDRIERMASGLLHAAPEAIDARAMVQQISPRRTRSGTRAAAAHANVENERVPTGKRLR